MNRYQKTENKIRAKRQAKGYSQEFMAEKLGFKSTIGYGDIERGKTDLSIKRLEQIAKVLDCSMMDLLPNKSEELGFSEVSEPPSEYYAKNKGIDEKINKLENQMEFIKDLLVRSLVIKPSEELKRKEG